jgi:hypothetical protein
MRKFDISMFYWNKSKNVLEIASQKLFGNDHPEFVFIIRGRTKTVRFEFMNRIVGNSLVYEPTGYHNNLGIVVWVHR